MDLLNLLAKGRGSAACWELAGLCCLLALINVSEGADHIVGANRGWQVPADAGTSANLNYTVWASKEKFIVGDELTFNYQKGAHSVFQVNYSVYTNCTFSMWYGDDWIYNWTNRGGKTKLVLNESRAYYFACGMGNHCQQGMKVAVNVTKNNTDESLVAAKEKESTHSSKAPPFTLPLCYSYLSVLAFFFISMWTLYPTL